MKARALGAALLLALVLHPTAARADWDDIHYHLTYMVARMIGYTPEQAYRVAAANASVNTSPTTEPRQMDAADFFAGADPDTSERQRPRWMFHAFINAPAWRASAADPQKLAGLFAQQDAALKEAARSERNRNPGVLLHYRQDKVAHDALLPTLDSVLRATAGADWLAYQGESHAREIVRITLSTLSASLEDLAPTQRRRRVDPGVLNAAIEAFMGANAGPGELGRENEDAYIKWALSQLNPNAPTRAFTAEQLATMQGIRQGPDLSRTNTAVTGVLDLLYMKEPLPDVAVARKQYQFDARGNVLPAMLDSYVITGALRVTLQSATGEPQEPVEMVIKAPPIQEKQAEYDLIKPTRMNVPSTGKWENLPIGKVHIELRRDGKVVQRQENVVLDKREQEVVVKVGAPVVAAGPVWVLTEGFPKINPDNLPNPVTTPAAAGLAWMETVLTRLSPDQLGKRIIFHKADGSQSAYGVDWILAQAPPSTLAWDQPVSLNIIGQAGPSAPPTVETWLDFTCHGLRAANGPGEMTSNAILSFGHLGLVAGKLVPATNETLRFTPAYMQSDPVQMTLSMGGGWSIRWEWHKGDAGTLQQPQPPVTPATPVIPATPTTPGGQGPKLGLTVKTIQGPGGPEVVIVTVAPDSPFADFIEPGQSILVMEGTLIHSVDQIRQILSRKQRGDKLEMQLREPDGGISDMVMTLD